MNVYDSARIADVLARVGYAPTEDQHDADLIILNTCHIREKAAEKMYSELGRIRHPKHDQEARSPVIAVAGCVAQAEGSEILRRAPYVDLVLGPQTYHRLPAMLARLEHRTAKERKERTSGGIIDTEFPAASKFDFLPSPRSSVPSAFLTVQEGCDKFCAFCVVPYTRGAEFSRPAGDVLREACLLVEAGAREITLLGQNVNAYHGAAKGLAGLIQVLAEIEGLERIRYTTSHPRDMNAALVRAHAEIQKLMPYLHLPVQSGSDRVLERMNRRHTVDDYRRVIENLRRANSATALSSDFIVGHPGETDEDFEATLALVREVGYAQAYSFKYSPRPGTPGADMDDQVPEAQKSERLFRLQTLLNDQQLDFNRRAVGTVLPVLFDRRGRDASQLAGRSPYMQAVHVDFSGPDEADEMFGAILPVRVVAAHANSLAGVLDTQHPERRATTHWEAIGA